MDNFEETNRIEDLSKRLNSKNESLLRKSRQGILHKIRYDAPTSWQETGEKMSQGRDMIQQKLESRTPVFKKFFIFSLILFVLAGGFAVYKWIGGGNSVSNNNIDVTILGNSFAAGGEDVPLQIEVVNKNTVALELADLLVEYPKGSTGDQTGDYVRLPRISIGTLGSGKRITENVHVVLFGEQGSAKDVKATLEYRVAGSNAIFVKETVFPISISSSPISLAVSGSDSIASNQEFSLSITATASSKNPTSDILVHVDYPPGFSFEDSNPKPTYGNNTWDLGSMTEGMERTITLKGIIFGEDNEERSFRVAAGESDPKDKTALSVVYNSYAHLVTISKPFLSARLVVNDSSAREVASPSGASVPVVINWQNNLPVRISDVVITAHLSGNAFDKSAVKPNAGFYDSSEKQIIWDKNTVPQLASVEPGESGTLDFSLRPSSTGLGGGFISSPALVVSIDIEGRQTEGGGAVSQVSSADTKTIKIGTDLQVSADIAYAGGPFANTGPVPPKAEQQTTYTVTWSLTNSSNEANQVEVKTILPTYVNFLNKTYPSAENISYDTSSRTVTWRAGRVLAGTGLSGADRNASFQIGFKPSTSQIDTIPNVTNETVLSGADTYTNATLSDTKSPLRATVGGNPLSGKVVGN